MRLTHAVGDNTPLQPPLMGVGGRFEQASVSDPVEPCQGGIIDRMSRVPNKHRARRPLQWIGPSDWCRPLGARTNASNIGSVFIEDDTSHPEVRRD